MPPCRSQMLHQLQASSFLRTPSFALLPVAYRTGKTRNTVLKLTAFPSRFSSFLLPYNLSSRSYHLLSFFPSAPPPPPPPSKEITSVIRKRKGDEARHGAQRDTNFRLNLIQGAKGCARAVRHCFR